MAMTVREPDMTVVNTDRQVLQTTALSISATITVSRQYPRCVKTQSPELMSMYRK